MEKELFKLCQHCGKKLESKRFNRKYCSKECFKKSRIIHGMIYYVNNREKILYKKNHCKNCGKKCGKKGLKNGYCLNKECQKEKEKKRNKKFTKKYHKKINIEDEKYDKYDYHEQITIEDIITRSDKRNWIDNIKKNEKCSFCGEIRWYCLVFHHIDPKNKSFGISEAVSKGYDIKLILEEIKKCMILCSNCHIELHYKNRLERKIKKEKENKEQKKIKYIKKMDRYNEYKEQKEECEEYNKQKEENKIFYYKIVEEEIKKDWIKELWEKADKNSKVFKGNQFTEFRKTIKEKINISKEISEKLNFSKCSVSKCLQIYKRGTEDQKRRAREGIDILNKIYCELKPIRNIRKDKIQ